MFVCEKSISINSEKNRIPSYLEEFAFEIFFEERRWLHANPTIYTSTEYRELMKNYIIETEELKKISGKLFKKIVEEDNKYIFLLGKRGIGKTTFLNYFLNTKTKNCSEGNDDTLNDKDLTWIRIDATKIYRNILKNGIDFEEYLYGQILYVYFRYADRHSIILRDREQELTGCFDKVFNKVNLEELVKNNIEEKDKLLEYLQEIKKYYQKQPNFEDCYSKKPYGNCNSLKEERYNCKLAQLLLENLKEKLILFIDGVDNLDYSTFLRENSIKGLVKFLFNIGNKYFKKIIISVRPDTYEEIKREINPEKYGNKNEFDELKLNLELDYIEYFKNRIEQIKNKECNKDDTIDLKEEVIKFIKEIGAEIKKEKENKNEIFYYKNDCYNRIKKIGIDTIMCFLKEKKKLLEDFEAYLNIYENVINKEFEISINELFDNDFREIIVNISRCFFYLRMDFYNRISKQKANDFKKYLEDGRTHNVLKNAIVKNGNLYGISFDEISYIPPYRNIAFTNMFNIFGISNTGVNYPPIIYFLILKIIKKYNIKSISNLKSIFKDYNELDKIDQIVAKFIEYGYIKYNDGMSISLTKKGEFFVEKFFSNMFFLHSNVYNGLLRKELIDFISPHKRDFSDYINKTLENVTILLYDLYLQLKEFNIYIYGEEKKMSFNEHIKNEDLILHFKGLMKQIDGYTFDTIFKNLRYTYKKNTNSECNINDKCNEIIEDIKKFLIVMIYGDISFENIKNKYKDVNKLEKIKILMELLPKTKEEIADSVKYMKFIYGEDFYQISEEQIKEDFETAQKIDISSLLKKQNER